MSLKDDFIKEASKLKTLEIQTIVGEFDINAGKVAFQKNYKKPDAIYSEIDLLTGDIRTGMTAKFLEEPFEKLREYHALREQQAHDIMERNIGVLQKVFALLKEVNDEGEEKPA
ncbi:hypothetical protein [Flexithrix dorotheae]|uniref:hypothetical protein n=1 Tax=Flexithrix dorotheae TaxID=70993 RepID=UPI00037D9151|nr:hypothetical protein [Flexithrix dorotheae]